eukprot:c39452_g1_i1 orf=3-221(-)
MKIVKHPFLALIDSNKPKKVVISKDEGRHYHIEGKLHKQTPQHSYVCSTTSSFEHSIRKENTTSCFLLLRVVV